MNRYPAWISSIALVAVCALPHAALSQPLDPKPRFEYVPATTAPLLFGVGAGLGVPYGGFGVKGWVGYEYVYAEAGLGFIPVTMDGVLTGSLTAAFLPRTARVRPKITASVTNTIAAWAIKGPAGSDLEEGKTYPGWAVYGGMDFRLISRFPLCLDVNVGYISPFAGGMDMVKDDYEAGKDRLESQGYTITDGPGNALGFLPIKISVGINLNFGRHLRRVEAAPPVP